MRESATNPSARSCRDLHAGEEGMLSLTSLFVVLGFLILISLLANVGTVTARKLETQNAADSTAYAAGIEMARGMNSLTAINHLIGELTAMAIMIHSLGGDELYDGKKPSQPTFAQLSLEISHGLAEFSPLDIPLVSDAYDSVSEDIEVGGAIYDARKQLKYVLAGAFDAHAGGAWTAKFPPTYAVGVAAEIAAAVVEAKTLQEWKTLDVIEKLAKNILKPAEKMLRNLLIPLLSYYASYCIVGDLGFSGILGQILPEILDVPLGAPYLANKAAIDMGDPNLAECTLYPLHPQLPVQKEPQKPKDQKKSQLMRASTPWVQWWRIAWMNFGLKYLTLSGFAGDVQNRTNEFTPKIVKDLRENHNIRLYILKDLNLDTSDKTREKWMSNSAEADKLFTVVGLAHRPPPDVFSRNVFRQENPDGFVCYAQAMFYNANPQRRNSGDGNWQPIAGWDTLNWLNFDGKGPRIPEYTSNGANFLGTPPDGIAQPRIQLNWHCKLVPTSRLDEATVLSGGIYRKVLGRTLFDVGTLPHTH